MISYEKIRQSFQSWNLTIAILYIMNAIIFTFSLFGGAITKVAMEKQPSLYEIFDESTMESLRLSTSPFALFTFGLGLIITIIIVVLAFINRSRAQKKQDDKISYLVYYIGIGWAIASVGLELIMLGRILPLSPFWLLLFGFFHVFTLRKAQLLKEKE